MPGAQRQACLDQITTLLTNGTSALAGKADAAALRTLDSSLSTLVLTNAKEARHEATAAVAAMDLRLNGTLPVAPFEHTFPIPFMG